MNAGSVVPDVLQQSGSAVDADTVEASGWRLKMSYVFRLELERNLSSWDRWNLAAATFEVDGA